MLKNTDGHLIKATSPLERLNIDFKGPLPSTTQNKYLLTIVDEYSRFPFAFPCPDMSSSTVIHCLSQLFSIFGMPAYIHSDRGSSFISQELVSFLHSRGIATSRTTPYNPEGNGQVERYNGIIWKAISLALRTRDLKISQWEIVLCDALHSVRSLLCTSINCTPHERMFNHQRRSNYGTSLPSWLTDSKTVFLKKNVRQTKYDPLVEEVELIEANPEYALVRHQSGRESTVSLKHLAPRGDMSFISDPNKEDEPNTEDCPAHQESLESQAQESSEDIEENQIERRSITPSITPKIVEDKNKEDEEQEGHTLRRSTRNRRPPRYFSAVYKE